MTLHGSYMVFCKGLLPVFLEGFGASHDAITRRVYVSVQDMTGTLGHGSRSSSLLSLYDNLHVLLA